jgi:hypothetical protein
MFKKIHSNRDPQDTVFRELKKEFRVYFDQAGHGWRNFISRYPKFLFGSMIGLMLISLVLSFTVFRLRDVPLKIKTVAVSGQARPVSDGFSRIIQAGAALKETISLKKFIDSITAKPVLSEADSVRLEQALDRLQNINKNLNLPK